MRSGRPRSAAAPSCGWLRVASLLLLFAAGSWAPCGAEAKEKVFKPRSKQRRQLQALERWLDEQSWPALASPHSLLLPEVVINSKLYVARTKKMGLGVWTRSDIEAGEPLASIPISATVSMNSTMSRHSQVAGMMRSVLAESSLLGDATVIILGLLFESRGCGPGDAHYAPYLDMLSGSMDHIPLLWAPADAAMLEGSLAQRLVTQMRDEVVDLYQSLQLDQAVHTYCPALVAGSGRATLREVKWATAVVMSNLFGVDPSGAMRVRNDQVRDLHKSIDFINPATKERRTKKMRDLGRHGGLQLFMVPWAHLFNHNPNAAAHYSVDLSSERLHFWTAQPYDAGDQVFLNYGDLTGTRAVVSYGMLDAEITEKENADSTSAEVLLRLSMFGEQNSSVSRIQQAVIAWRAPAVSFALTRTGRPTPATQFLLRALAIDGEEISAHMMGSLCRNPAAALSSRNECGAAAILRDVLVSALNSYTTTLDEDADHLRNTSSDTSRNRLLALRLRIHEKKILHRGLEHCTLIQKRHGCLNVK